MTYEVNVDARAHDDIATLPGHAWEPLAEAMTFLQLTPWNAPAINPENPFGAVRTLAFGDAGMVTLLILDDVGRVDVLTVTWGR